MLTHPQVQRYSTEAGLGNIMIAETEIVLTYLLQLMADHGILDKLAFKGGTCLRKMFIGSGGRFSTDLDFTMIEEHDHEDVVLAMMEAFERPFHGMVSRSSLSLAPTNWRWPTILTSANAACGRFWGTTFRPAPI